MAPTNSYGQEMVSIYLIKIKITTKFFKFHVHAISRTILNFILNFCRQFVILVPELGHARYITFRNCSASFRRGKFGFSPGMSLDFPFFASTTLEDVASVLRYINVSILFYSTLTTYFEQIEYLFM